MTLVPSTSKGGSGSVDVAANAYRDVVERMIQFNNGSGSLTDVILVAPGAGSPGISTAAGAAYGMFYILSSDYAMSGYTTKFKLRTALVVNNTAPGVSITVTVKHVTAFAGGNGQNTITLGTTEFTNTHTTPAANSQVVIDSTAAALVSDGFFVITATFTVIAVNSSCMLDARMLVQDI